MAADFDQFPFYDPLIKEGTNNISDIWMGALSTFIQTLVGYLTQNGMLAPLLTTEQRDAIQNPVNGQFIYNTTIGRFEGREEGSWVPITIARLTTAGRDAIQNPANGDMIYNTSLGRFQGREAGFWRTFTLV